MYTAPKAGFNEEDPLGALLPDDFSLHSAEGNLKEGLIATYYNEKNGVISFKSIQSNSKQYINSGNANVEHLTVSEYDAVYSVWEDNRCATLVWYNSDLEIFVSLTTDSFSKTELINIAQIINQQLIH